MQMMSTDPQGELDAGGPNAAEILAIGEVEFVRCTPMFTNAAPWYDAVYGRKAYESEADDVLARATSLRGGVPPASVLDVACGTGQHLARFAAAGLAVAGTDLDPTMLAIAKERVPTATLATADMVELDLDGRFDLVTCLFSSIGYVITPDRLRQAVASMARHLTPGGVLVVEPWITPESWIDGRRPTVEHVEQGDWTVVRMGISHREGMVSRLLMHHLVSDGREVRHLVDEHTLGLFSFAEYREAFEGAGLQEIEVDEVGLSDRRGLVVGRAPE